MGIAKHIQENRILKINPAFANRSSTLLTFGDSLLAPFWRQFSLTGTVTVSAGVATFTLTATHNVPVGTKFRMALMPRSSYNAVHTVAATPSSTTISFAAPADAVNGDATTSAVAYFENDQNTTANFMHYLKCYSKQRFYTPWSGGVGADDTTEALARIGELIAAIKEYDAGRVVIMLGANDSLNAVSADASVSIANIESICNQILTTGVAIDLCTPPPFGTAYTHASYTTQVSFKNNLNRGIRQIAQRTNGVNLMDHHTWLIDPTNANGYAIANAMYSDGIHYNTDHADSGARIAGQNMAAIYNTLLGEAVPWLPDSQADSATFSAGSKNKFTNPLMQGTVETSTWSVALTGGSSKVDSLEARNVADDGDAIGNNFKTDITLTAAGTHLVYQDGATVAARLTTGKTYIVRAALTVDPDVAAYVLSEINIGFTVGGFARNVKAGLNRVPAVANNFVVETPPFIWPAGATLPLFYLRSLVGTTSGNPKIEWGRADLYEFD